MNLPPPARRRTSKLSRFSEAINQIYRSVYDTLTPFVPHENHRQLQSALACEQETIWAAVGVLRAWIEKYGVPRALYTDWKNVYVRAATAKEILHGKSSLTQFGRMCERLGIKIIAASSPQAKAYASYCTSCGRAETRALPVTLFDSFTPIAGRGGLAPGCSYKQALLAS